MTPDNVFKFVNVRPVQLATESVGPRYAKYGPGQSPLHKKLLSHEEATAQQEGLKDAEEFLKNAKAPDGLVKLLSDSVAVVHKEEEADEAREGVEKILGQKLPAWLQTDKAKGFKDFLWDRVYAHVVAPALMPQGREGAYSDAKLFSLLEALARVADNDDKTRTKDLVPTGLLIPSDLLRRAGKKPLADVKAKALGQLRENAADVLKHVETLHSAANELRHKERVFRDVSQTVVPLVNTEPGALKDVTRLPASSPSSLSVANKLVQQPQSVATTTVVVPKPLAVHQSDKAKELLSAATLSVLADRAELEKVSAARAAEDLEEEAYKAARDFVFRVPKAALGTLIGDGSLAKIIDLTQIPDAPSVVPPPMLVDEPTPEAKGLRPLGIGDLLVVKQKLLRYEANEIAHIENILKSEKKGRTHKRLREIEETVVLELEEIQESEKNLQTTERFELHKETEKTIETTTKFDAGVSVSASYGVVSVNAHADFALTNSIQESAKTASTFAREVTEKAVSRIQQRTRDERTRRTLERFEEVNEHELDNTKGGDHVIGIYRWLDKFYRARVVNYGRRLMFEFILPEPAAFYLFVTGKRPLKGVTLEKPVPPSFHGAPLQPRDLTRNNYHEYVAQYKVQDLDAYPEAEVIVAASLVSKKPDGSAGNIAVAEISEKLVAPPDYQAHWWYGIYNFSGVDGMFMDVFIGGRPWSNQSLVGIEKIIPITAQGWAGALAVNVCAQCEPTQAAIEKWKLQTYEAILNAYSAALSQYNEQVAAVQVQEGVAIEGRNPANNRKIERDELRKASLRMLTDEFAFLRVSGQPLYNYQFHAMSDTGTHGYPEFDTSTAMLEGRIIQFFEQAFEWNNVVYRFYPYFWARKDRWDDRYPLSDPDPFFTDFLKAGSARVVVPVHPGYAEALLYYLHTGEIWNGGEPPTIDDPLYVSIIEELRSDADINDSADNLPVCSTKPQTPCIVTEWEVKVPTDLVYLQKGSDLNP